MGKRWMRSLAVGRSLEVAHAHLIQERTQAPKRIGALAKAVLVHAILQGTREAALSVTTLSSHLVKVSTTSMLWRSTTSGWLEMAFV